MTAQWLPADGVVFLGLNSKAVRGSVSQRCNKQGGHTANWATCRLSLPHPHRPVAPVLPSGGTQRGTPTKATEAQPVAPCLRAIYFYHPAEHRTI